MITKILIKATSIIKKNFQGMDIFAIQNTSPSVTKKGLRPKKNESEKKIKDQLFRGSIA